MLISSIVFTAQPSTAQYRHREREIEIFLFLPGARFDLSSGQIKSPADPYTLVHNSKTTNREASGAGQEYCPGTGNYHAKQIGGKIIKRKRAL